MSSNKKLHPVKDVYDGIFNTFTGIQINLLNPQPEMICLEDITKGLSNVCRFGGQIRNFSSVAKHTLLVWYLSPAHLKDAALLHDMPEAYLGDVIKPLKVILATLFEPIERKFAEVIFKKYHVDIALLEQIKSYDDEALRMEHEYFHLGNKEWVDIFREMVPSIGEDSTHNNLLRILKDRFGKYDS